MAEVTTANPAKRGLRWRRAPLWVLAVGLMAGLGVSLIALPLAFVMFAFNDMGMSLDGLIWPMMVTIPLFAAATLTMTMAAVKATWRWLAAALIALITLSWHLWTVPKAADAFQFAFEFVRMASQEDQPTQIADGPGPACALAPEGDWVIQSGSTEAVAAVTEVDVRHEIGKRVMIAKDRVTYGDTVCEIAEVSVDRSWQPDGATTRRPAYNYACKNNAIIPTLIATSDCDKLEAALDGGRYLLVREKR